MIRGPPENGSAAGATGSYDAQDRLTRYGNKTYAYTASGELTTRIAGTDTTRDTYDPFGNLIKVQFQNGDVINYLIDGRNRRVGRKLNGTVTARWLYQDQLEPVAELDASGAIVARYVYGTRAHVPDYVVKGGTTYRIISDHLGSVRLVVNASTGAVAQRVDYDGFGRVTLDTSPGFQSFGYAGGLYDTLTALVRFGARDYDAEVGRWTSKDPIGFLGGSPNLFAYVDGNPIDLIDPSGTDVNSDLNSLAGGADALSCGWASKMRDKYFPYNDIDLESAAYAGGVESGKGIVVSLAFGGIGRFAKFLSAVRGGGRVAGRITGYTDHGLNQAIGRDGGRGVHPGAILNAVRNPTRVVEQTGGRTKYIGEQGTVILNSEGKVITVWGRPRNPGGSR